MANNRFRSWGLLTGLLACCPSAPVHSQQQVENQPTVRRGKTAQLVQRAMPAVVSVNAIGETDTINPFGNDPWALFFFGNRAIRRRSSGSGVIVDPRGYVVTCAHVVKGARLIKVTLDSGRTLKAEVVFQDDDLDLAVLKLVSNKKQPLNLPYLPLASQTCSVGDSVIAIGNAFSVGQTVTKGIISAGYRVFGGKVVIQTDSQINPGNSGGPIVFYDGTVGGIASAIASRTGASHGVGFFIPSLAVQYALRRAFSNSPATKVPVRVATVDASIVEAFSEKGVSIKGGVSVMAATEEFSEGDIIVRVADCPVESKELFDFFSKVIPVGERYRVDFYAQSEIGLQGVPQIRSVYLVAAPRQDPQAIVLQGDHALNGVAVADITLDLAAELGLPTQQQGVVVLAVPKYSSLRPHDVLLEMNGHSVTTVKELKRILTLPSNGEFSYKLRRGDVLLQNRLIN